MNTSKNESIPAQPTDAETAAALIPTVEEAEEIALRFINGHFKNPDRERPRMRIPADPMHDDDIRLLAFIRHFSPLRAELERLKVGEQILEEMVLSMNAELQTLRSERDVAFDKMLATITTLRAELQAVKEERDAAKARATENAELAESGQLLQELVWENSHEGDDAYEVEDVLESQLKDRDLLRKEVVALQATLKERSAFELGLNAQLATARTELEGMRKDSEGLDWLLKYITNKGINGLRKLVWSVYDEEGKLLNHRATITEDEVGEIRFDRPAIDAARSALSGKGGEA